MNGDARPYEASWIDRFIDWIEGLPIPIWSFYLLFYLGASLSLHISLWLDNIIPIGQLNATAMTGGIWAIISLIFIHSLERTAENAVDKFAPLIPGKKNEVAALRFRLTTMPAKPVFWMFFLFSLFIVTVLANDPSFLYSGLNHPLSYILGGSMVVFSYSFIPVLFFNSFRQLNLVTKAFELVEEVNIFHQQPLYAFTQVTMRAGLFWLLMIYLTFLSALISGISETEQVINYSFVVGGIPLALGTFIWPLWGIHRRILEAKLSVLEKNSLQIEKAQKKLYAAMDQNNLEEISVLDSGLNSLYKGQEQIQAIATWPWLPGTLRNFLSAIFLPMLLWALQLTLTQNFGN